MRCHAQQRSGAAGRGTVNHFSAVPRALAAPRGHPALSLDTGRRSECAAGASRLMQQHGSSGPSTRRAAAVVARAAPEDAGPGKASQQQRPVGIVIVDHGSRAKASNDMLLEFVSLYRATTGAPIVEPAHMELADPSIADAVARCVEQGAGRVVVAPYFLSRGRHVQQDIPALVKDAAAAHPEIECVVADPIGIDPLMVRLISNRVAKATEGATAGADSAPALQGGGLAAALAAAAAAGAAAAVALAPAGVPGLG